MLPSVIEVGLTSNATMTLDDGTSISGGTLSLGNTGNNTVGTLDVEAGAGTGGDGRDLKILNRGGRRERPRRTRRKSI